MAAGEGFPKRIDRRCADVAEYDADGTDRVDLGLARGQRMHQADDAGGPGHVALHVLHAGGRLDDRVQRLIVQGADDIVIAGPTAPCRAAGLSNTTVQVLSVAL